jgi:hypothetical protein
MLRPEGRRSPTVTRCSSASRARHGDDPALNSKALGWAADFWRALRPFGDGVYVNVPNAAALDWEREYYGSNRERLRQVKAKYDPENVFSFEQSVPLIAG